MIRFLEIVWVLSSRLVFYKLTRHKNKSLGVRLREAFERLGTAFIKLGQALSTRYELLSREDCKELQQLLDSCSPVEYYEICDIFEDSFGVLPEEAFDCFEKEPISSASIAQVHVAWLKSGEKVAVKFLRPNIVEPLNRDMRIAKRVLWFVSLFSRTLRKVKARKALEKIHESLLREVDLRNEAKNLKLMEKYFSDINALRDGKNKPVGFAPKLYPELSSQHVVTMDFLEGTPMNKCDDSKAALASLSTLLSGAMRMLVEDEYYFHTDPHPANILVMDDGDLGLLDFGDIGTMKTDIAKKCFAFLSAVYQKDTDALIDAAQDFYGVSRERIEVIRYDLESYIKEASSGSLGDWFFGMLHISIEYDLEIDDDMLLFARTIILLDGVAKSLDPNVKTEELIGEEFRVYMRRKMWRNITETDFLPLFYMLTEKFNESPERVTKAVSKYIDDPLRVIRDIKEELKS